MHKVNKIPQLLMLPQQGPTKIENFEADTLHNKYQTCIALNERPCSIIVPLASLGSQKAKVRLQLTIFYSYNVQNIGPK